MAIMMDETAKYAERVNIDRAEQLRQAEKPHSSRKEGKSVFDEMLEQNRQMNQKGFDVKVQEKTVTQQAVWEPEKQKEQERDRSKDKEKEEEKRQESREERTQTVSVGKKVVAKEGLKQNRGDSGGRGFEGGGTGSQKGERSISRAKKGMLETGRPLVGSASFAKAFQTELMKRGSALPPSLGQEILDKIVRYVRIGLNKEGNKELELHLHKEVFKGLRLRLTTNHGRVSVHFLTADGAVRRLFQNESLNIHAALKASGIAVSEIRVT